MTPPLTKGIHQTSPTVTLFFSLLICERWTQHKAGNRLMMASALSRAFGKSKWSKVQSLNLYISLCIYMCHTYKNREKEFVQQLVRKTWAFLCFAIKVAKTSWLPFPQSKHLLSNIWVVSGQLWTAMSWFWSQPKNLEKLLRFSAHGRGWERSPS